jgi:hypothetical protein
VAGARQRPPDGAQLDDPEHLVVDHLPLDEGDEYDTRVGVSG